MNPWSVTEDSWYTVQQSGRGIIHDLSPKHWKSNMTFKYSTLFLFFSSARMVFKTKARRRDRKYLFVLLGFVSL